MGQIPTVQAPRPVWANVIWLVWALANIAQPKNNPTLIDLSIYKLGPAFANIYGLGAIYVQWLFAHRKIKPTRIFNIEPFGPLAI